MQTYDHFFAFPGALYASTPSCLHTEQEWGLLIWRLCNSRLSCYGRAGLLVKRSAARRIGSRSKVPFHSLHMHSLDPFCGITSSNTWHHEPCIHWTA